MLLYALGNGVHFTLAFTIVWKGFCQPDNFRHAGITNKFAVTVADTGFPGKLKTNFLTPLTMHVANVVGLLFHKNMNRISHLINQMFAVS